MSKRGIPPVEREPKPTPAPPRPYAAGPTEQGVVTALAAQAPLKKKPGPPVYGNGGEPIDVIHLDIAKVGDFYSFRTPPTRPWRGVHIASATDPMTVGECMKEAEAFAMKHHATIEWSGK